MRKVVCGRRLVMGAVVLLLVGGSQAFGQKYVEDFTTTQHKDVTNTTAVWDTAAGDAILRAAGGRVVTTEGAPLGYGPDSNAEGPDRFRNPWFIATGGVDPLGK